MPDPSTGRHRRGDYELRVFRWPAPGRTPVLLVHGIGMGHAVYDRFVGAIRPHCDVTAVDLPGFGDAPEPTEALSIPATADLLAEAIRAEGGCFPAEPLVAVGHSMGAQIVAELAARHPELVARVVLVAPTVNAAERSLPWQALRMLQDLSTGERMVTLVKGLRAYEETGLRWFAKKAAPTLAHRLEACLPAVRQPALVLRGSEDPMCPRGWAVRVTALLPDAELRQLGGRGHEAIISSGEPAAHDVLDWLARIAARA